MGITILERRGLERERRMERVVAKFAEHRVKLDKRREPERQKSERDIREETRVRLEKRSFFKRD